MSLVIADGKLLILLSLSKCFLWRQHIRSHRAECDFESIYETSFKSDHP